MVFRKLYFLVLLTATFLVAVDANAQQIQGEVRYPDSGQPVLEAHVECSGTGGISNQMTSRNGKFFFRVSPGNYYVTVTYPGYQTEQRNVTLTDTAASDYLFIKLRPLPGPAKAAKPSTIDSNVPAKAQTEFDIAEAALAQGKKESLEEAIRHYQQAVKLYPNFVQAQLKLGTAYMDLGDWDKAEQTLKKTVELEPKDVNAFFALGEIYLRQKKDEEAEKVLLQGLQIEDRSFQGHLSLSRVYWSMASKIKDDTQARPSLEKAYDQVKKALELNPNLAQAHLLKGNLLLRVRRAADAQHEFEEYLRLEPKGAFAEQTRATVEKIKKALETQPKP
jgi:tetratricopeptide (TPR) repeat protein